VARERSAGLVGKHAAALPVVEVVDGESIRGLSPGPLGDYLDSLTQNIFASLAVGRRWSVGSEIRCTTR
jgi:hypothetical protein